MKDWRARLERYGKLGLVVWFSIFATSIAIFTLLVKVGVDWPWLTQHTGDLGPLAAGYVITKLLTIPRAALTLSVTPVIARRLGRGEPPG